MAEFQSKGRGQSSNSWISEAFENLLLSIIIQPVTNFNTDPFSINKTLAVSLYSVVQSILPQHSVRIKWPNDLLIDGRKVCGLLVENNFTGSKLNWCVAGIGLNVNQKFEHISKLNATSLSEKLEINLDRIQVLKQLLEEFEHHYLRLQSGESASLNQQFDQALLSYHELSSFVANEQTFEATVLGCDSEGRLILQHEDGLIKSYLHGTIKQIIHA